MALEEISLSGRFNTKSAGEANNYLHSITCFDFVVSLVVANKVLGYLKSLSSDLQGWEVDVVSAYKMVDSVHSTLQEVKACIKYHFKLVRSSIQLVLNLESRFQIRTHVDDYHDKWFIEACAVAAKVNVEPTMSRIVRRQILRNNTPASNPNGYLKLNLTVSFLDHVLAV